MRCYAVVGGGIWRKLWQTQRRRQPQVETREPTNWMAWSSSPWGQRQCEAALTVLVVAVNGWNAGGGDMLDVLGLETKKVEYVDPEQARLAHIADISGHESNIPRVRAVASVSLSLVGGGGGGGLGATSWAGRLGATSALCCARYSRYRVLLHSS